MKKKKVVLVVGTRPEAIKMAPIYFALKKSSVLEPFLLSSGQHRQMLDQALRVFGITPNIDLDLMQSGQSLAEVTVRVLQAMSVKLAELQPDAILVQGDTTTVLASSLAAFYLHIPIGHVEAGLRTYDMTKPFPEEMNRRVVSPLAAWNFAPTELSAANLRNEQIAPDRIFVTGNTVVDALLYCEMKMKESGLDAQTVATRCGISAEFTKKFLLDSARQPWILVTGHRRESFGDGFDNICRALVELRRRHPELGILYPVHMNPQVRRVVERDLNGIEGIMLIDPIQYEDFIWLMSRCRFLLSDSGGVQEEAPSLGKPVLVMRESTERPEGVTAGTTRLVGTDVDKILAESELLLDEAEYANRVMIRNPYGDGRASERIVELLESALQ